MFTRKAMAAVVWTTFRVCVILSLCTFGGGKLFVGSPSYGDLVLQKYSWFLYISLAPDGMELSEYTYPVCGDNFNERNKVTRVISRQLGYERCTLEYDSMESQNSFGSAGINCTGTEYHIMRCQISSPETSSVPCRKFIRVHCIQEDSLYDIGSTMGNKAFQGQVLLHPHFPTGRGIATASMGLVAVKQEGDNCRYWRFVEVSGHVDSALASTLCRQMGFTRVSAVFNKHEAESLFHLDFSLWLTWLGSSSILTSEIKCQGLSHECLGCCNYTKHFNCGQAYESKREVNEDSILVLRCSAAFYNDKKVPSEGGNLCSFHQNVIKAKCDVVSLDDFHLANSTSSSEGRLEYYWNSRWNTLCATTITKQEADLVCRRLGFLYATKFGNVSSLGYSCGSTEYPSMDLCCTGNTPSKCSISASSCDHSEDAAIVCTNQEPDEICEKDQVFLSITSVPGVILLVVCIILVIVIAIMCIHQRCLRCRNYQPLNNNN